MAITVSRSEQTQFGSGNFIQVVTTDLDDLPPSVGFWVDLGGTLSCRPRANSALIDLIVDTGVFYPVDLAQVDISGSTTTTTVHLVREHL